MTMRCSKMSPVSLLAAVGFLLAAASTAGAADKPRVGYLGADVNAVSTDAVGALDAGAMAGIEATSAVEAVAIPRAEVTRTKSGRVCASEDCAKAVGGRTGAEYLVRADVKRTGKTDYAITLDLIRVSPFGVVFSSDDQCPGCVAAKLGRRIELGTSALVAKLVESLEAKPLISAGPAAMPEAGATSVVADPVAAPVPVAPPAPARSRWKWVPWTAGGVAVVSAASAWVAWAWAGDGTCTLSPGQRECPRIHDTKPLAYGLGGLALVSAVGAALSFYAVRDDAGHEVAIGTTGTNLIITGRF
jgi:hypothetical protein